MLSTAQTAGAGVCSLSAQTVCATSTLLTGTSSCVIIVMETCHMTVTGISHGGVVSVAGQDTGSRGYPSSLGDQHTAIPRQA